LDDVRGEWGGGMTELGRGKRSEGEKNERTFPLEEKGKRGKDGQLNGRNKGQRRRPPEVNSQELDL